MRAWRDLTEYHEAVQPPPKAFADPGLKGVTLELDRFGMPKPATGGNAVVYKANERGGFLIFKKTWAIRCFLRPISDHAERRSEEHTSELQSQSNLVCRLLLEKKKTQTCVPSREIYRRGRARRLALPSAP